jgi:hypothetical protein
MPVSSSPSSFATREMGFVAVRIGEGERVLMHA